MGKEKFFYLNYPLEKFLADKPGAFDGNKNNKYWEFYNQLKESVFPSKIVSIPGDRVGFTEHVINNNTRLIIAVNYFPTKENITVNLKRGWKISEVLYGEHSSKGIYELNCNDALILKIEKNIKDCLKIIKTVTKR